MHGDVVHVGADAVLPQKVEHLAAGFAAVGAHLHGIEVQGGAILRVALRQDKRQTGQQAVVSRGKFVATGDEFVDALHLAHAEGGLQFGHVVVVAEVDLLVIPSPVRLLGHFFGIAGDTVAAQQGEFGGKLRAVGEGGTAFGGGDDFDGVEAEYGDVAVSAVADFAALIAAADGVGRVFNDFEAVLLRERVNGCHIAGFARKMDGHDDFGQAT